MFEVNKNMQEEMWQKTEISPKHVWFRNWKENFSSTERSSSVGDINSSCVGL